MINAFCMGQNYVEQGQKVDSYIDSDSTHIIIVYAKNGKYYRDTVEIPHSPSIKSSTLDVLQTDSGTIFKVRDTIPVIRQVVDTAHEFWLPQLDSVTLYNNDKVLYWHKGKTVTPIDLGVKEKLEPYTTMLYSVREQEQRDDCSKCWPTWKHLYYLTKYKEQLPENIVVLQSQFIK